ncbi:MAG: hypothetical protein ABSC54_01455 [Smithellaceae bacterium]
MAKSTKSKLFLSALLLIFFISLFSLAGCGGSTSSTTTGTGGTTTPTTDKSSLTFSLTKLSDGTPTTSVSGDSPAQLKVVAIGADGKPILGKTVTFTAVTTGLITFNGTPDTGTALTGDSGANSGVATIDIYAAAAVTSGATDIDASVTDAATNTITGSTGISVAPANLQLSALTITPGSISAGGSAAVSIEVQSASPPHNTYLPPVPVSFTSTGVQQGKATITAQVYTVNGIASATYTDINFGATDTITATLVGTSQTKSGQLIVSPAAAGSIIFVSATPTNISLQNSGYNTTSVVVFKVLDTGGNPIGKLVDFSLSTTTGGITITGGGTTYSATSDPSTGLVQTIVTAGTAPTPVRVLATIHGTTLTSTSSQLVISTGIPTQNNFSLAATVLNMEGWNYDGTLSVVTARLSDRFQNPVPDGTAVTFIASGGQIEPSCTTTDGACSVNFYSANKRPRITDPPPTPAKSGRVVILAYAIGEESFTDLNGNGIYNHLTETFIDMPDPWLDVNEDGVYNNNEPFIDTYTAGSYSAADGCFNGVLRDYGVSDSCYSSPQLINVRRSLTIVLSSSDASITINNGNPITLVCGSGTPVVVPVLITDINENIMPVGTAISFATTAGTIISPTSFTVGNGSPMNPGSYNVVMQSSACPTTTGTFKVTVTTQDPVAKINFGYATVND